MMCKSLLILDWGIGGLGAYKRIRRARPDLDILYWSDSGALPYGKMTQEQLIHRLERILTQVHNEGIQFALVACNAASTALPYVNTPIPILGVIQGALENFIHTHKIVNPLNKRPTKVGVIGGQRTIDSGAWTGPLEKAGFSVLGKSTQPLSALIERGNHLDRASLSPIKALLRGVADVDELILACTHYAAASKVIQSVLPQTTLFDPVDVVVRQLLKKWSFPDGEGKTEFRTTGDPSRFRSSAKLAFDIEASRVEGMNSF